MTRPQAIELAREMWAGGDGWKLAEIRAYLAERGHSVHPTTVKVWVDDSYRERRYASLRPTKRRMYRDRRNSTRFLVLDEDARERLADQAPVGGLSPDLLRALRLEDGLTYTAIAAVARRFFGEEMSEDQARYRLYELGAPKNANKSRSNRERPAA